MLGECVFVLRERSGLRPMLGNKNILFLAGVVMPGG